MADFKTPNLCGANPELNNALSKLDDLKNEIASKLDSTASEAAAAFETGLADVKAGLDGLALDLPEVPDVNFQSELTGLINDIDKTTVSGFAAFNAKLAQLELDFGDTLKEKGLSLDTLITDATTKLSAGGNVCDLAPNIEIPAGSSGTGVTTETKELLISTGLTVIAVPENYKEIVSVQGKSTSGNFFSNISGYKVDGRIITIPQSYAQVKVTYIISLIKEKPVEAKQADTNEEEEEVSIVTTNVTAKDTSIDGLIAKFRKDIESAPSSKDVSKDLANAKAAIASIGSPEFKAQQEKDFATWQTEYKKLKADPLNYKPVVTKTGETVKATTIEAAVTKETKTDKDGFTYTETKRVTSSDAGLTHRIKDNFIDLVKIDTAKEVLAGLDSTKYPDWYETIQEVIDFYDPATSIAEINLNPYNQKQLNIVGFEYVSILRKGLVDPVTRVVQPAGIVEEELQNLNNRTRQSTKYYEYALGNKLVFKNIAGMLLDLFQDPDIFAITISYQTMDKIDPNYKG
tara:strand:+ start:387 stop:1937 length:1551 start_codon:yes stop_codon:yes gene_type:complete